MHPYVVDPHEQKGRGGMVSDGWKLSGIVSPIEEQLLEDEELGAANAALSAVSGVFGGALREERPDAGGPQVPESSEPPQLINK